MEKNCLIIGGGLGGLVTACLLSKEGCQVKVVEKHHVPGGGLHCFKRHDVLFETGIHYVSGFQDGGVLSKLFTYLGIEDKIKTLNLDEDAFDIVHIGSDNAKYCMGIGKENFISNLSEMFPAEADNIRRCMDELYAMADEVPLYNMRVDDSSLIYLKDGFLDSVGAFIESFVADEKLQSILAWNNSLYGGEKYKTPVYIHALIAKFYIEGASRFVGGSQHLADAMVDMIQKGGGEVLTSAEVKSINVDENKRISNVVIADGRTFEADYYISDIHPASLFSMIDPTKLQKSYRERLSNLENSYSVFTVYIVFKPNTFKFLNSVYYYYDDYNVIWNAIDFTDESFPPGFMLITPPTDNQGEYAEKAIINCMMSFDRVREWENTKLGHRPKDYVEFKKDYQQKIIDKVNLVFPDFIESIESAFSATPLTVRDYLGTKDGSLYGYKKDCTDIVKSQVQPRTKIENLLLTGQNINLHGILGVPLSSIVTSGVLFGLDNIVNKINESNQ